MANTPLLTTSYPTLQSRLKRADKISDSTAEFVHQLLGRRSVAEGYAAGELCVALSFRLQTRLDDLDSGELLAIYERGVVGGGDDSLDPAVPNHPRFDGRFPQRHKAHVDDAVFVAIGKLPQDGEGVAFGGLPIPSLVWLEPAQGGDVRPVEHLDDGEAVEIVRSEGDGAIDGFRFLVYRFPPQVVKDELPDQVVEGTTEVVKDVPDPAAPIEDRRFFGRFDIKDVVSAFRIKLLANAKSAEILEGSDFFVESLGMSVGLTELGVAAIERMHRGAS